MLRDLLVLLLEPLMAKLPQPVHAVADRLLALIFNLTDPLERASVWRSILADLEAGQPPQVLFGENPHPLADGPV